MCPGQFGVFLALLLFTNKQSVDLPVSHDYGKTHHTICRKLPHLFQYGSEALGKAFTYRLPYSRFLGCTVLFFLLCHGLQFSTKCLLYP